MDDDILSVVSDALSGILDRVEVLEARVDRLSSKRAPASTVPLPGRFPWKSPDGDLRYTQPLVTVES